MRHHRRPFQAVPARHSVVDQALSYRSQSSHFYLFLYNFYHFFPLLVSHLSQHRFGVTHGGLYHGRFSASSIYQEGWGVYYGTL